VGSATRALAFAHRWLGIACGALFVLWFLSGIVMLYARMPALDPAVRLARLPALELATARVHPAEAARRAGLAPERLRLGMVGDRPVCRFAAAGAWRTVFADDGQPLLGLQEAEAVRLAIAFEPACAGHARHDRYLLAPDQWTLQLRALLPLHRVACGDAEGSFLYVSERTGEVVLATTTRSRLLAYLGPVTHWLYFTPLRRHGELWLRGLLFLSAAGSLLALSGLCVGVARFAWRRRTARCQRSPYAGLLRWHHYAGLVFGVVTFGWILSGGLSLDPLDWHASTSPSRAQREGVAGGPLRLDGLDPERLRRAAATLASRFAVRELEVVQLRGRTFLLAHQPPEANDTRPGKVDREPGDFLSAAQALPARLVALDSLEPLDGDLPEAELRAAFAAAMPHARVETVERLARYDAYYYDRAGALPLPVLRARFDDTAHTWLYLDPARGLLLRREERSSRLDRWLYRALHRWDWPGLHERRPLWDLVVIALLLGGLTLSAIPLAPALRRLAGHAARLRRRLRPGATPRGEPAP
jgi:hypothetical protein